MEVKQMKMKNTHKNNIVSMRFTIVFVASNILNLMFHTPA